MFKKTILILLFFTVVNNVWASDFTVQKLSNGHTIVVQEIRNNPIVTIDTWVRTGSINETEANSGVAHFLEHLFFKGTKKYPAGEFDSILESKGAIINAATSKDYTHYYITIPSMYFDKALELHSDMLMNPQIPRKELEQERKVVLEEISKDLNNPAKIAYDNLNSLIYEHHPYKRKVIGNADVISTIRREEILEFFNDNYNPSNLVTVIVGDINTTDAIDKVSKSFNLENKKNIKKHFKKEPLPNTQKRKLEYFNTSTSYMLMGFLVPGVDSKDVYTLDVIAQILGGGKSSRLYKHVKEEKGLTHSIYSVNYTSKDSGTFFINANFVGANTDKLEKSIFEEIHNIQKYGITEEELQSAKKMIEQATYYSRESTSEIATQLGYIMTLTDSIDDYENYISNINKVSLKDVQYVAQKYLGENKARISIVLPKALENQVLPTETKVTSEKLSENNGVSKYKISNGTTLILNQHNNNDIIAMSILVKGGGLIEKIAGEADLMAKTLLRGTKKYSAQELSTLMEENGIIISPKVDDDCFCIELQTTKPQLDLAIDILNEIMNNALFDEYELEKARTEMLNRIKQRYDIPMNIAFDEFTTLAFTNGAYSKTAKTIEKTLPKISRTNVIEYYDKITDAKNVIISANGDISCEKATEAIGKIFKNKNYPKFSYSDYKYIKSTATKSKTNTIKDLKTAWLVLGWQTNGVENKKDFVTLKLINTMLGGGMSSRLFKELRDQDGLAYQLGSSFKVRALAGAFYTYIGTNPDTLEYSKSKILKEIGRLKLEFVSDSELEKAKERLKGSFIIALETNSDKASNLGSFELLGFGYDFLDEYVKMIDEITASDIIRVANKYFNNIYVESVLK